MDNTVSWEQVQRNIERAHYLILEDIRKTQIVSYSKKRIAQLWPNGYDLSAIGQHTNTTDAELQVIGGVFNP